MTENVSEHHNGSKDNVNFEVFENGLSESELQRHINEEFSNLSLDSDVNEVFKALTYKNDPVHHLNGAAAAAASGGSQQSSGSVTGPKFYKYFQ